MVNQMDKMIPHKYGEFKECQVDYYQDKLRKKIFWLILYTDEKTKNDFDSVDVVHYHENLLLEISSCNELLKFPRDFVELINSLEMALIILKSENFNFNKYRKLVLDAGAIITRMKVGDK